MAALAACGGASREAPRPPQPSPPTSARETPAAEPPPAPAPPPKLLSIAWSKVQLATDADALALWAEIAPTAEDWEAKLDEIPDEGSIASKLALALLREGNFTCAPPSAPAADCAKVRFDVPEPPHAATLADPCLRRLVALWAIVALDEQDLPAALDALRAIAAIPPPESQLVASALDAIPEADLDRRLELLAIARAAGHRELVNTKLDALDDAHLVAAITKHHIDGALDLLTARTHRAVFVAAITDDALPAATRLAAMRELVAVSDDDGAALGADVEKALVTAARAADCEVAAEAVRQLMNHGNKKLAPARPRTRKVAPMMRAMCVLASYELASGEGEPTYLLGYIPARGLELVKVEYDPYSDTDDDGDGDPHTLRTTTLVPRSEVVLPELPDMVRALTRCTGATCKSPEREFRFGWKPGPGRDLLLARLEVVERPPCPATAN